MKLGSGAGKWTERAEGTKRAERAERAEQAEGTERRAERTGWAGRAASQSGRIGQIRRFAAGIDVTARGVFVVVLSRSLLARGSMKVARPVRSVRIEGLAHAPLVQGALRGAYLFDRPAITDALCEALGQLPRLCARVTTRCAMALPASATLVSSIPLAQLAFDARADDDDQMLAELEPLVLAEAERVAGIERGELAVDWRVEPGAHVDDASGERLRQVTITAAAREHLDARIECTAAAGMTLCALDGEAHAALRALRYMAAFELASPEPCIALWMGSDGMYGWYLDGAQNNAQNACEMRYPAPGQTDFSDALNALRGRGHPGCALVAGDPELLAQRQFSLADVGHALGCPVLPFECASFAGKRAGKKARLAQKRQQLQQWQQPESLLHTPACAVAFGLALRGVNE